MTLLANLTVEGHTLSQTVDAYPTDDTVLDALRIIWGRPGAVSHPDPAVLTAKIALVGAVPSWLAVGSHTAVTTSGTIIEDRPLLDFLPWADPARLPYAWVPQIQPQPPAGPDGMPLYVDAEFDGGFLNVWPGPRPGFGHPEVWSNRPKAAPGAGLTVELDLPQHRGYTASVNLILFTDPETYYYQDPTQVTFASSETGGVVTATLTVPTGLANPGPYWVGARIEWDRDDDYHTWAQEAGTWSAATGTWQDDAPLITVQGITLRAPVSEVTPDPMTIFEGTITSVSSSWDARLGRPVATLTASDILADINATPIGDTPWDREDVAPRLQRILTAALGGTVPTLYGASDQPARTARARDADSRSAGELARLTLNTTLLTLYPIYGRPQPTFLRTRMGAFPAQASTVPIRVHASKVPRDGITLTNDTSVGATIVQVTWNDGTTDKTATVTTPDLATLGARTVKIETEATSAATAKTIASDALAVLDPRAWIISGVHLSTVDAPSVPTSAIVGLLDPWARLSQHLLITGTPTWVSSRDLDLQVLGASITAERGGWTFDLDVLNVE